MAHGDITHTEIPFEDKDRAVAFYRAVFGWDAQEMPGYTDYPMWRGPNQVSGGGMGRREEGFETPRFYVEVDSIDDVVARAVEFGGRLWQGKDSVGEDSWVAVVTDPDGNQIGLYQGDMAGPAPEGVTMSHGDVTHVDIPVWDTNRAKVFYSALFGWEPREVPGFEGYPMWQAPNGALSGGLAPRDHTFTQPRCYVHVDSIDATLQAAEVNGGSVARPRQVIDEASGWAVLRDPEGNHIGLYEESQAQGSASGSAGES